MTKPKIIQICFQRDGEFSQGGVLGLGDDGVTYCIEASRWSALYPPIDHDGKTYEEKYKIMEAAAIKNIRKQGSNWYMQKALTECGVEGFEVQE